MHYDEIMVTAIITAAVIGAIFWIFFYPAKVEPEVREVTVHDARRRFRPEGPYADGAA